MITDTQRNDAIETSESILSEPVTFPVYRCLWCKPHRWFMYGAGQQTTMYVDAPADNRIPSDGICRPCFQLERDKILAGRKSL